MASLKDTNHMHRRMGTIKIGGLQSPYPIPVDGVCTPLCGGLQLCVRYLLVSRYSVYLKSDRQSVADKVCRTQTALKDSGLRLHYQFRNTSNPIGERCFPGPTSSGSLTC